MPGEAVRALTSISLRPPLDLAASDSAGPALTSTRSSGLGPAAETAR